LTFKCTDNIDLKGRKIILYAGNIGEGQGLHNIIPKLASALSSEYIFRIIGDGGRRNNLQSLTKDMENVQLIAPVNRAELIIEYQKADILFLHLNDYEAFYKVLPSKIFEYASTGKPILAGVAGFSASFLASEVKSNVAIFQPGNADEAILSLKTLCMGCSDRSNFIYNYARSSIMKEMANNIISVIQNE
jgi:glycosyltransferase involved in cell wall biosynthesis